MSPIQWIRLDIKKASNVAKEVDDVLKLYTSTVKLGDRKKIEELRKCIEERIYELEDFETAHDDDERHVLFDKQRLRLRRALQQYANSLVLRGKNNEVSEPSMDMSSGTALYNTLMGNSHAKMGDKNQMNESMEGYMEDDGIVDEVGIVDSISKTGKTKAAQNTTTVTPNNNTKNKIQNNKKMKGIDSKDNDKNHEGTKSSTNGTIPLQPWVPAGNLERSKKSSKKQLSKSQKQETNSTEYKPIYEWEKIPSNSMQKLGSHNSNGKDVSSSSIKRQQGNELTKAVTCEGIKYFASPEGGYYDPPSAFFESEKTKEMSESGNSGSSLSTLDFAIILNEAEYNVVLSRKRALAKKDIKHESTLNLDSPYVDKWRVDEVIYRPSSSSDKWVDPKGFNITPQL